MKYALQWRHNARDGGVPIICSTVCSDADQSSTRVSGLCEGNPLVTGGFPSQKASEMKDVSIWWRHHVMKS